MGNRLQTQVLPEVYPGTPPGRYLGTWCPTLPEDQHKDPKDLQAKAIADCFRILATTLHMANPQPIEPAWYSFGFCTWKDEWEERPLGGLYQRCLLEDKLFEDVPKNPRFTILERCESQTPTFTEFWQAYKCATLIKLMDLKASRKNNHDFSSLIHSSLFHLPDLTSLSGRWSDQFAKDLFTLCSTFYVAS